jgi:hypothetical protein
VSSDGSCLALSDAEMAAWKGKMAADPQNILLWGANPEQQAARVMVMTGKGNGDCVASAAIF